MVEGVVRVPVPAELVARAITGNAELALPAAARLGSFAPGVWESPTPAERAWGVAGLAADLVRAQTGHGRRRVRLAVAVVDVVAGTWSARRSGADAHQNVVTAVMTASYRSGMDSPVAGLADATVVALAAAAARRAVGAEPRWSQLPWLYFLALPGAVRAVARVARRARAAAVDEEAAGAEARAAALDARAEVSVDLRGLVHLLAEAEALVAAAAGPAVAGGDARALRLAGKRELAGSAFVKTVCDAELEEQVASRPAPADWVLGEPEPRDAYVRLDPVQAATLRAWLRNPGTPRGLHRLSATRTVTGRLVLRVACDGAVVDLDLGRGGENAVPLWRFDVSTVSLAVAAAVVSFPAFREPSRGVRARGLASAGALVAAAAAADRWSLGASAAGRRALFGVCLAAALSAAPASRLDGRLARGAPTAFWQRIPWPVYGLVNVASVWVGHLGVADAALMCGGLAAALGAAWHGDGSDAAFRYRAGLGFWPAAAFTWRLDSLVADAAEAHRLERLARLRSRAAAAADELLDELLAVSRRALDGLSGHVSGARVEPGADLKALDAALAKLGRAEEEWTRLDGARTSRSR